jgi:hypothetical protein
MDQRSRANTTLMDPHLANWRRQPLLLAAGYALVRTLAGWRPAVSLEPAAGLVRGTRRPLPSLG